MSLKFGEDPEIQILTFTIEGSSDNEAVLSHDAAEQELTRLLRAGWHVLSTSPIGSVKLRDGHEGPALCVMLQRS